MPKSNAYLAWAVFLFIFALLCLQMRSCLLDTTPRVVQQPQVESQPTQEPTPDRPTLKRREPEVEVTPNIPNISESSPTIKEVGDLTYRVTIKAEDGWFDTKIPFIAGTHIRSESSNQIKLLYSIGKRFKWYTNGSIDLYSNEYQDGGRSEIYNITPDFRDTLWVKAEEGGTVLTISYYENGFMCRCNMDNTPQCKAHWDQHAAAQAWRKEMSAKLEQW